MNPRLSVLLSPTYIWYVGYWSLLFKWFVVWYYLHSISLLLVCNSPYHDTCCCFQTVEWVVSFPPRLGDYFNHHFPLNKILSFQGNMGFFQEHLLQEHKTMVLHMHLFILCEGYGLWWPYFRSLLVFAPFFISAQSDPLTYIITFCSILRSPKSLYFLVLALNSTIRNFVTFEMVYNIQ